MKMVIFRVIIQSLLWGSCHLIILNQIEMNRNKFLKTTGGLTALAIASGDILSDRFYFGLWK